MVGMRIKRMFFDRPRVMRAVNRARREALAKGGARIRTESIFSIKTRKGTSPPGHPPYSHVGVKRRKINRRRKREGKAPLRVGFRGIKHILFEYDSHSDTVVIGPVGIRGSNAPNALEFGGPSQNPQGKRVRIRPRPFMGPALTKVQPELPAMWHNAVRGN